AIYGTTVAKRAHIIRWNRRDVSGRSSTTSIPRGTRRTPTLTPGRLVSNTPTSAARRVGRSATRPSKRARTLPPRCAARTASVGRFGGATCSLTRISRPRRALSSSPPARGPRNLYAARRVLVRQSRRHRAGPGSERNRHDTGTGSGTDRDSAPARRSLATRRVPRLVSAGRPNRGRRARRDRRGAWDRGIRGPAVIELPTAWAVMLAVVVLVLG